MKKVRKSERIYIRLSPEEKTILKAVSILADQSITDFVVSNSLHLARMIIYARANEKFSKAIEEGDEEVIDKTWDLLMGEEGKQLMLDSLRKIANEMKEVPVMEKVS